LIIYILRRLIRSIFVIWSVTVIAFVFLRLTGDPTSTMLPFDASLEDRQRLREAYGLDKPIITQYTLYLENAIHGDFGRSLRYRQPALDLVLERYPNTVQLAITAMVIALLIGIPLGILGGIYEGSPLDTFVTSGSLFLQSMPSFWLGIMLIIFFAVRLGLLPTAGKRGFESLILPAITLAASFGPQIVFLARSEMANVLHQDFIRTARAKGVKTRLVYSRHAFSNILIPIVTIVGLTFGTLLSGAAVTETVFAWPGVGLLAVEGVFARDFPLVQAAILTMSIGIVLMNLLVDISYPFLDPRIRNDLF
jgi:peptide/nickel transport system permease protein